MPTIITPLPAPERCGLCELGVEHTTDTHQMAVDRYATGLRDGLRQAASQARVFCAHRRLGDTPCEPGTAECTPCQIADALDADALTPKPPQADEQTPPRGEEA